MVLRKIVSHRSAKWSRVRAKLKKQFEEWGITSCEIGLVDCQQGMFLGFAHTRKRRWITTEEQLREVVLACQNCHTKIEYFSVKWTGQNMYDFLSEIIRNRNSH